MKIKAKPYLENQKTAAENRLSTWMDILKEKGLTGTAIKRDPVIRKIRADIRKANHRLASIAAQERLNAERARAKAEKSVKKKDTRETAPAEKTKPVAKKKVKKEKEKEPAPAVKSKKQDKDKPAPAEATQPVASKKVKQEKEKEKEPAPAVNSKEQSKDDTD